MTPIQATPERLRIVADELEATPPEIGRRFWREWTVDGTPCPAARFVELCGLRQTVQNRDAAVRVLIDAFLLPVDWTNTAKQQPRSFGEDLDFGRIGRVAQRWREAADLLEMEAVTS